MPKMKHRAALPTTRDTAEYRAAMYKFYNLKYYNLFMSKYQSEGLEREEREYILKQLWSKGAIAAVRITDELVIFTPFAPQMYNIYGTPTAVTAINERGAAFIPTKVLKTGALRMNEARRVEEPEVVLGYAFHNRPENAQGIRDFIAPLIDIIVDIEMKERVNRYAQNGTAAFKFTPENENKMTDLAAAILGDEPYLAVNANEIDGVDAIGSGVPLIIENLENYKRNIDNDILTILGIDNSGRYKAERQGTDEMNANNELINQFNDLVADNIKEFTDAVNKAYGTSISITTKEKEVTSFHDDINNPGEREDKEDEE